MAQPRKMALKKKAPERWSATKEKLFLSALAGHANVTKALRIVRMSSTSLYKRRQTQPAFREAWDEALSEGYATLEAEMLARALDAKDEKMADGTKLTLLSAHAKQVGQFRATRDAKGTARNADQLRAEIAKRLDRLATALGLEIER
jgi:hypothetical protein